MAFEFCAQRTLSCSTDSILVCGEGIDGNTRSVRTDQNNVLASLPTASTYSQIGRLFATGRTLLFRSDNTFEEIIIINPPGSGRIMYLDSIKGGTVRLPADVGINYQSTFAFVLYRNPSPVNLVELATVNLNFGSPENSAMIAVASDFAPGEALADRFMQTLGLFQINYEGRIIVPPGSSLGIGLTVRGFQVTDEYEVDLDISVFWYEVDLPNP